MGMDLFTTLIKIRKQSVQTTPSDSTAIALPEDAEVNFSDLIFLSGEKSGIPALNITRNYDLYGFLGGHYCTRKMMYPKPMIDVDLLNKVTRPFVEAIIEYYKANFRPTRETTRVMDGFYKEVGYIDQGFQVLYSVQSLLNFDYNQVASMVDGEGKDCPNKKGWTYRQFFTEPPNGCNWFEFLDELRKSDWKFAIFSIH